ncbi:AAA family ATPase [Colletotrichum sojae]|uniref:AAA family ATPase n=1 Tax=Colletotrichum sojae TaxID=2175907 RepID=A0A8H6IQR9_9PEZI|nr:AAA family ATPase [Colletotrichum sojae]
MASIKTVVKLSTLDAGTTSSAIIGLANIKGALLYGPPGTGKTLLARSIAKNTESNMLVIDPALVKSPAFGLTEKLIRAAFALAKKLHPCIIFIDEADSLLHRRDSESHSVEAITQLLQSMDGLVPDKNGPFVLAATNRPMDLDSAILRRVPFKVSCGLPDAQARTKILLLLLKEVNRDLIDMNQLVATTDGFSGADLKALCGQAALDWAIQQNVGIDQLGSETETPLTDVHFSTALKKIKPANSGKDLAVLEEFTKRYGPATWASASELDLDFEKNEPYRVTGKSDLETSALEAAAKLKKVMRWIDSLEPEEWDSPYYWEKKLLSLLFDPNTIETSWSHLAIDRKMEQEVREMITHHHAASKSTKAYGLLERAGTGGALLYGPHRTGKTQLARVLSHESGTVVLCATPADLVSKYWGEGPKAVQGLFNLGKLLSPSIIFIDEAEAMFPAREHLQHQHEFADSNQLLHEMDGLSKSNKTPFILIATNLPGRLDPAVLRRVPSKFYFGLPSMELRSKIFAAILKDAILHPEVDTSQLAFMTPGLTGSDIRALCVQTAISCDLLVEDGENEGKRLLTMSMFVEALGRITPTATKEALSSIRAFSEDNHPPGLDKMRECDAENLRIKKSSTKGTANSDKGQRQEWKIETAYTGK